MTEQKRIIVVDDDEALRRMVVSILHSKYRVFSSENSKGAFALAHEHGAPDLVILDVMMPDMDGRDLGKWLQAGYRTTKLLFISGYDLSALTEPIALGPNTAFLKKPFQPKELVDAVQNILGTSA